MTAPGKLAALVTQAPEEDRGSQAIAQQHEAQHRRSFCRCLSFRGKPALKLASVVPAGDEQEAEAAVDPHVVQQVEEAAEEPAAQIPVQQVEQYENAQLSQQVGKNVGRKTLVLDLDETLVHSSFRAVSTADIIITVELEGEHHRVFVRKRPGVDEFLVSVAQMYEVVVYTASMAKYADPLLDELDQSSVIAHRLFREACTRVANGYVKDLSRLGRCLKNVIIIDNSPTCYALQPDNAIPIKTWRDDTSDREQLDLIPILYSLAEVNDIPAVLKQISWAAEDEDA